MLKRKTRPYVKLAFEVDREFHQEVKMRALKQGISLRKWLARAVAEKIQREKQYE